MTERTCTVSNGVISTEQNGLFMSTRKPLPSEWRNIRI